MKLLLTLVAFCSISFYSLAQSDNDKPDERVLFQSKVRQLVSYLAEGNESAAKILFKDVKDKMEGFIRQTKDSLDNSSGAEKRQLKDRFNRQQQLVAQFDTFKYNLIRNKESINTWSEQFIKTLY